MTLATANPYWTKSWDELTHFAEPPQLAEAKHELAAHTQPQLTEALRRYWIREVKVSLRATVEVHSQWWLHRQPPTEELRVVSEELDVVMEKLDYESDDDAGFFPSAKTRRKHRGYANAHTTAHALQRTNEALRALTNAVHVLHDIEKGKYALEEHG